MKVLILLLLLSINLHSQILGSVSGRITDIENKGIFRAVVYVLPEKGCDTEWLGDSTLTNKSGYYSVEILTDCTVIIYAYKKYGLMAILLPEYVTITNGTPNVVNFQDAEPASRTEDSFIVNVSAE